MNTLKFIIIALVVLSAVILFGIGYVWREIAFTEYQVSEVPPAPEATQEGGDTTEEQHSGTSTVPNTPPAPKAVAEPEPALVLPEPVVISATNLPEGQRKLLDAFGLGDQSLTITPEAVSCAIDALGKDRAFEIENGAVPTMSEGLTLLACLK